MSRPVETFICLDYHLVMLSVRWYLYSKRSVGHKGFENESEYEYRVAEYGKSKNDPQESACDAY